MICLNVTVTSFSQPYSAMLAHGSVMCWLPPKIMQYPGVVLHGGRLLKTGFLARLTLFCGLDSGSTAFFKALGSLHLSGWNLRISFLSAVFKISWLQLISFPNCWKMVAQRAKPCTSPATFVTCCRVCCCAVLSSLGPWVFHLSGWNFLSTRVMSLVWMELADFISECCV